MPRRRFIPTLADMEPMLKVATDQGKHQEKLVLMLFLAGLRETELTGEHGRPGLRVGDVDFHRKYIQIVGLTREQIPVDDQTLRQLQDYITAKKMQTHDRIIPLNKGELSKAMMEIGITAGVTEPIKEKETRFSWAPSPEDVDALMMTALVLARKSARLKHHKQEDKRFRNYLLTRILALIGIRGCEAVGNKHLPGIRVQDISFERKKVTIYPKRLGIDAKPQEMDLDDLTLNLISRWIDIRKLQGQDRIFQLTTRQVHRIIKDLARDAEKIIKRCANCHAYLGIEETECPMKICLRCHAWNYSHVPECSDCDWTEFEDCGSKQFQTVKVAYADLFAPHRLRHFGGSLMTSKVGIYQAKEFLRHKDVRTTQLYAHQQAEQRRRVWEETMFGGTAKAKGQ